MPAKKKPDDRQFKVGDKIRVNLHHGKIEEDAVVRAVSVPTITKRQRLRNSLHSLELVMLLYPKNLVAFDF